MPSNDGRDQKEASGRADTLEHELAFEIPQEIKKAVALGDLSENAEYHTAKQRQEYLKAQRPPTGQAPCRSVAHQHEQYPKDKVGLGSTVTIFDSTKNEEWSTDRDERGVRRNHRQDLDDLRSAEPC